MRGGAGIARPLSPFHPFPPAALAFRSAFTLIEMLVVIAIIGIVAAISVPSINNIRKADGVSAATRQLLDDLNRARQLAISQRTTVYLTFVPSNYWNYAAYTALPVQQQNLGARLLDKQLIGYNFITLRNVGDQPGRNRARYLGEWRSLPEGIFIPPSKFEPRFPVNERYVTNRVTGQVFTVTPFDREDTIPFPSADTLANQYVDLPCIAFDHLGQLISDLDEEIIPIARGSASVSLDANKRPTFNPPTLTENPPGNSIDAYTLIVVDRLTGRARIERQQVSGN